MMAGGVSRGRMNLGIGRHVLLGKGEIAGIDHHGEVGTAAQLIGCIDRIVEALVEVGAQGSRKMTAG